MFASGTGTNAENLISHFSNSELAKVELVLSNNAAAGVLQRAARWKIPATIFNRKDFIESEKILQVLLDKKIDLVILAGFLWLVPGNIIHAFEKKIINIHPALLPGFGGKGFYGKNVHQSVIDSGAGMSGITIHYVNDQFDDGEIIFQAACYISRSDTADSLAEKIHSLEYRYFPVVVEKLIQHPI